MLLTNPKAEELNQILGTTHITNIFVFVKKKEKKDPPVKGTLLLSYLYTWFKLILNELSLSDNPKRSTLGISNF